MDAVELITHNVTYISYYLFQFLHKRYSPREIFAIAVRMDAQAYVDEGSLDTEDIFRVVFDLFDANEIRIDDYSISVEEYFENPQTISCIKAFSLICITTMTLLFNVDNEDEDVGEIYDDISYKAKEIEEHVESILSDEIYLEPDNELEEKIVHFIFEDDEFDDWNSELELLIDEYDEDITEIRDLDIVIDEDDDDYEDDDEEDDEDEEDEQKEEQTNSSKYNESILLGFIKETDSMINHKKEHDDFIKSLDSAREQIKDYLLSKYPRLTKSKIEKMYKSSDNEDLLTAGMCYFYGIKVDTDFEKAYNCFIIGAKNDDPESAYYISVMYLKSLHVSYNPDYWIKYLALACRLGEEEAVSQWEELLSNLKEYNEEKERRKMMEYGPNKNVMSRLERPTRKPTYKTPIVFSIVGGALFLLGTIILATSNALGAIPMLFGVPFLIIAVVLFVKNSW